MARIIKNGTLGRAKSVTAEVKTCTATWIGWQSSLVPILCRFRMLVDCNQEGVVQYDQ